MQTYPIKHLVKRSLLALIVGLLFAAHSAHAQYPYYQQELLNERVGFGANATGGAGGEIYWVTNLRDDGSPGSLRDAVTGDDRRWIMFKVNGDIYTNPDITYRMQVGSNKTIDGRGASISIHTHGLWVFRSRNVIIENVNMVGGDNDGIEISDGAGDVWLDHISFNGWSDEAIGIARPQPSTWTDVTISWCKFFGQDKTILIGGIAGDVNNANQRVTLHHNWFYQTGQRHPRLRRGLVHAYNNFLDNWGLQGMASSEYGQLFAESNYFVANQSTDGVSTITGGEPRGYSKLANNATLGSPSLSEYRPDLVFSPGYSYVADPAPIVPSTLQARAGANRGGGFINMSTRANVQSGEGTLISGFYLSGTAGWVTNKVIIRALGPSLSPWFPNAMADTTLTVYNSAGQQIAYNNNWGDDWQWPVIQGYGLAPSNSLEAALVLDLPPGGYTAVVSGGTGIANLELYDVETAVPTRLVNISSRATVDPNNPPIAGFYTESGWTKVLVRGIGPSLGSVGIQNPISDPTLTVYDAYGTQIAYNNNWQDTQGGEISAIGWQPSDWREASILINLAPGSYTVIMRDYWNNWGIGSLQLYKM
jgi:pectate lyase